MKQAPRPVIGPISTPALATLASCATVALIATVAFLLPSAAVFSVGAVALAGAALVSVGEMRPSSRMSRCSHHEPRSVPLDEPGIGIATVHAVEEAPSVGDTTRVGDRAWVDHSEAAPTIIVDVETVSGQHFRGHLNHHGFDAEGSRATLWPGVVLAVRFDPQRPSEVILADDMTAARAAFDTMLIRKGLTTADKLDLIRRGVKSHAVVTAMKPTGQVCEDYRQVELDVIVNRPEGGQFPAHEVTFIPATSVAKVEPGSIIDAYYRSTDSSRVAVCVPRS
ncbi:hypothetical protein [Williamsia muralis]|uniref:hypothetical protein n=1 Tax=Williamsia marianensis TaxID=85044 RepID=UPI003804C3CD